MLAHGGRIEAAHSPLGGLRITVVLPLPPRRRQAPVAMSRILIVEDEQDIAGVLRDYLRHAGHEVEHFGRRHRGAGPGRWPDRPDLMLLDIMLPGIGRPDVLRAMRARQRACR